MANNLWKSVTIEEWDGKIQYALVSLNKDDSKIMYTKTTQFDEYDIYGDLMHVVCTEASIHDHLTEEYVRSLIVSGSIYPAVMPALGRESRYYNS